MSGDHEDPIVPSRLDRERASSLLSSIVEHLPAMVFVKSAESLRFELFNKAGEELLGIPREEIIGKSDADLFPPEQVAFFVAHDRRVLDGKEHVDIPLEPVDGPAGRRWLHTKKLPIVDAHGVARHVLGISVDITDRHEAEEALRRAQDELERRIELRTRELSLTVARLEREIADRERAERALQQSEDQLRHAQKMDAIGRLAGGVAHDFNNMLSVILGHTELALTRLKSIEPQALVESLDTIRQAALRSAGLTQQLLAFSRQQVVSAQHLDLCTLVRDFEKMLRRVIGDDIELCLVESSEACPVRADPVQLEQVILNLAINARDAMPHGGRLTIQTGRAHLSPDQLIAYPEARPGPHVELTVRDEGTGMAPETLSRIFEPFFTTKAEGRGTGLGLSTVYGIVHQAGGTLSVESELDHGSTFRVFLPLAEGPKASLPTRDGLVRGGSERVLLVEDERAVRRVCALALRDLGYEVLVADDVEHAVELCSSAARRLDAVVTDVVMPGSSGVALVERLRALQPHIRALFISGYTDPRILDNSILTDQASFLQKPFTPDALGTQLRRLLDAPSLGPG